MCRSSADGGRRCPGSRSASQAAGHAGDGTRAARRHCYCTGSHKPDCPNYGAPGAMPPLADGGEEESYQGTPWQGYDEYMQRSEDLDRRVAAGESITDIMRQEQLRRTEERITQITQEGW